MYDGNLNVLGVIDGCKRLDNLDLHMAFNVLVLKCLMTIECSIDCNNIFDST